MEYEKIDEVARRQACERVKQIVKAIKTMKIKYYLDFSKISVKDKETYQKLEEALEKVSSSHNLEGWKVALLSEVSARYDRGSSGDGDLWNFQDPEDILKKCYGIIDAHVEALSKGKITQARECQKILQQHKKEISSPEILIALEEYKRKKFGELDRLRDHTELGKSTKEAKEETEKTNEEYMAKMKKTIKGEHVKGRNELSGIVSNLLDKQKATIVEIGGRS